MSSTTTSAATTAKAGGPASYFPSIEARYGRSIAEWKADLRASGHRDFKSMVAWLKDEHGFGHGHAAALVKHTLDEDAGAGPVSVDDKVAALFTAKKAHWRPVYDELVATIQGFGDVKVLPKNTQVGFATKAQFAMLQPSTADRFDVALKLPGVEPSGRLEAAGSWNRMMTHRVRVTDPSQVDDELRGWLRQAYDASR
ncbi:MAG TPA: DUF4287 domain-containing protein [Acidimicrobiales bacterium]